MFNRYITLATLFGLLLSSCGAGGDDSGVEYAPQMYHSVPYEPYSQILEDKDAAMGLYTYKNNSMPVNDYGSNPDLAHRQNLLHPVEGTVSRQYYKTQALKDSVFFFDVHKDSLQWSAANLKNPLPMDASIADEGKVLYTSYCSPCHGAAGDGKGKVGAVYSGVANFGSGAVKSATEGHIFHVITHGKGRMWPHKTQLNPEERWKVVRYVQKLQKGEQ